MSIVETRTHIDKDPSIALRTETVQAAIAYDPLAAKRLASEYLVEKKYEPHGDVFGSIQSAYKFGRMEIRKKVLEMIGQDHILHLTPDVIDLNNPPLLELKALSQEEVDKLREEYNATIKFLADSCFDAKSITKVSPQETYAKGRATQLAQCLRDLGQDIK